MGIIEPKGKQYLGNMISRVFGEAYHARVIT
jgi:hypothetical protein